MNVVQDIDTSISSIQADVRDILVRVENTSTRLTHIEKNVQELNAVKDRTIMFFIERIIPWAALTGIFFGKGVM